MSEHHRRDLICPLSFSAVNFTSRLLRILCCSSILSFTVNTSLPRHHSKSAEGYRDITDQIHLIKSHLPDSSVLGHFSPSSPWYLRLFPVFQDIRHSAIDHDFRRVRAERKDFRDTVFAWRHSVPHTLSRCKNFWVLSESIFLKYTDLMWILIRSTCRMCSIDKRRSDYKHTIAAFASSGSHDHDGVFHERINIFLVYGRSVWCFVKGLEELDYALVHRNAGW